MDYETILMFNFGTSVTYIFSYNDRKFKIQNKQMSFYTHGLAVIFSHHQVYIKKNTYLLM